MRQDKLTTKFQEALADAQSLALGNDNAYIEPVHLLLAMLRQDDGPRALVERAGANVPGLIKASEAAIKKLPQVQGHDVVQVGQDLAKLLQATEKEAIKRNTGARGRKARRESGLADMPAAGAIDALVGST